MKIGLRHLSYVSCILLAFVISTSCQKSGGNGEKAPIHAATQEMNVQPDVAASPMPQIDVENILTVHTEALRAIAPKEKIGMKPTWNAALDRRSNLTGAWFKAVSSHSDGSAMLLAMRMAEYDAALIPQAIKRIEGLKQIERKVSLDDVFDYHIGRMYVSYADILPDEEAEQAREKAFYAFSNVMMFRKSPYYHLAWAEKLKLGILLDRDITDELRKFIVTYPDYPELKTFRLALAAREYKEGMREHAEQIVQELAYLYPWSPISGEAKQWLEERSLTISERSFEEDFSRVESLRKARFWDDAETAAVEAMPKYPESYQLMVQHARIAYERSYHEEAAHRFEAILDKLGGETKDKLRPTGVIAYIYRAYGYMGNCEKALEYHAKNAARLGKRDRAKSTMEFALTCGAFDTAYKNAKIYYEKASSGEDLARFGFIAYLNQDYETAREKFAAAANGLSGTYKRRLLYFTAQATLKSAQKQEAEKKRREEEKLKQETEKEVVQILTTESNFVQKTHEIVQKTKAAKKSNQSKKSTKSSKKKKSSLVTATAARAKAQFEAIIKADSTDYYAILANSRLLELERGSQEMPKTPVIQTFGIVEQNPEPPRPWTQEFSYDEKEALASFHRDVDRFKEAIPELERVEFFHDAELYLERNALFRVITLESMGILRLSKRPTAAKLWTTKLSVDGHLVDNRRKNTGFWGTELSEYYFSLPSKKDTEARRMIADRQGRIYDAGADLKAFIKYVLSGFHDYYLARKYTPAQKNCGSQKNIDECSTLYPHAFSQAVIEAAEANAITPDIVWAVMNIESAFNPDSISHSDAYGLLQIIPMTGYKIADAMHIQNFGPYDLIRPENSIAMGTWYFAQILKKFHGYATLSMAAYNGGPHQVARWLTAYSGKIDHDAFVELIPLNEARNYVKKGMARLLLFHRIDMNDSKAFFEIPNTLPESFEEMPNY